MTFVLAAQLGKTTVTTTAAFILRRTAATAARAARVPHRHPYPSSSSSCSSHFLANKYNYRPVRTMATTTSEPRKYEWLVVVPDVPGMLAKRLEVRPTHFANFQPKAKSGEWKMGGAILSSVPPDDDPSSLQFAGSTLIVTAATRDEVLAMLREDVYAAEGVWDVEKAQMWPLKAAFRHPL